MHLPVARLAYTFPPSSQKAPTVWFLTLHRLTWTFNYIIPFADHSTFSLPSVPQKFQESINMSEKKRDNPVLKHALQTPSIKKLVGKRVILASASPRRREILRTFVRNPPSSIDPCTQKKIVRVWNQRSSRLHSKRTFLWARSRIYTNTLYPRRPIKRWKCTNGLLWVQDGFVILGC